MRPLVCFGLAMSASPVRIGAENSHRQSNACQGKDSRRDEDTNQSPDRHREKARDSQQSDKAQDRGANSPKTVSSPVLLFPTLVLGSSRGFGWVVAHAATSSRGVPQAPLDICRTSRTADAADRSGLSAESRNQMASLLDEVAISAPPLAGAKHVRAEVMARYASGFLNGNAVRCWNATGSVAPLAYCLRREPKSPGKRSLPTFHTTNCVLDSVHCANVKRRFTACQAMLSTVRRIDAGRSSYA